QPRHLAFEGFVNYSWWSNRYRTPDCGAPRRGISEVSRHFSVYFSVQSLQYLLFLPAIFRGLLQKLRRPVRRASFAPPPQPSGRRSNRDCFFRCVLLPVLSWDRARSLPPPGSFYFSNW